ncbi:MAG: SIMPL domain-containing protein [Planctomycetia bacterium]|nr:SIMPL domain-containing protein [Planctomycetia bacterium]
MSIVRNFVLVFVMAGSCLGPALAGAAEIERTISVTGQGRAFSPPDMAAIHTGVVTEDKTASQALAKNNKAMAALLDVLKEHKIAAKDVQTSSFHVAPVYKQDERGRTLPEIVAYRVTNQVRVHVRNLPDLGEVLDAIVQAGSNQVSGISFGIDDPTGVLNQARNRAVADARSRAELFAQAAGVRVGKVLTIADSQTYVPRPEFFARGAEAQAAGVPIATGEQEVQAAVHIVFALEDR